MKNILLQKKELKKFMSSLGGNMTENNNDFTNSENEKRFVNIAKEPIFIVVNDTFENEVLTDDDVVDCLNALHEENEQLKQHIDFADKLIDDLGHNEMKRQWGEYDD